MKQIILSEPEKNLLLTLMQKNSWKDVISKSSYSRLEAEVKAATIVPADQLPPDVVRLYSICEIRVSTGSTSTLQIVLPKDRDINQNCISVLAPMGLALFGYKAGDEILWRFPGGEMTISILKVTNPSPTQRKCLNPKTMSATMLTKQNYST